MISLKSAAVWLPEGRETAENIADWSGVPEKVVREKMGIIEKCRADKKTQTSEMAVRAATMALEKIDPDTIDLIIWTGSEYKDYPVWSAGIYVQNQLRLKKAYAFDMAARCSSNVVGLKVAKSMMMTDKKIKRVLLCGGHKTGDLVNYQDPTTKFLYNLSDGGSAMVLERSDCNPILESSVITDGSFSQDVIIPGGGTRKPARDGLRKEDTYLTVPDVNGMRERLAERSIKNFLHVIKEAATSSMNRPIDYLALLHMKRSAHDDILERLELKAEQSIYLNRFGHFGAPDQVLSLILAELNQQVRPGDHICLASAGIGYTWSAISLQYDSAIITPSAKKHLKEHINE